MAKSSEVVDGVTLRAAVLVDSKTHCDELDGEAGIKAVNSGNEIVWLDIRYSDPEAAQKILEDRLHFHHLAAEDAVSTNERPSLQEFEDVLFLSVMVPVKERGEVEVEELGFFLRDKSLVTVCSHELDVVEDWFKRWRDHPKRIGTHPAFLMHALVDAAVDAYFPMLDHIEDISDDVADKIFNGDDQQLPTIMKLKRALLSIRRAIAPTRDVLNSLLRRDIAQVPEEAKIYFQDVYDHALRLTDLVDTNRDAITSILDVHLSTVSNNLNVVVKKMTVLSTVLMTMALVAGVYGMNFEHMPELHWAFGYPYAIGLMFALGGLVLLAFKWVKWI